MLLLRSRCDLHIALETVAFSLLKAGEAESSDGLVTLPAASIASTGWSEPVPGWELHPLKSSAFHGALLCQLCKKKVALGKIPRKDHAGTELLLVSVCM
jgi:hypothetical protein